MSAFRYRLRRGLRVDGRAAVGLALVIALVGGLTLFLVAGALRTATAPDRYAEARGDRYDSMMEQSDGRPLTEAVEGLPAVDDVVSATFMFAGFLGDDGEPIDSVIAFAGEPDAFGAEVTRGRLPAPDAPHEFTASQDFVTLTGADIGDQFPFISISEASAAESGFDVEVPDGPSFDATLVGVVEAPASDLQDEYVSVVFPLSLLDEGSIGVSATESLVSLVDGADVADLREQLDTLRDGSNLTLDPAEWVDVEVRRAVATQANALWVVAGIVAVAGLVVVGQMASRRARLADGQRRSLSALGLTRGQLLADAIGRIAVPAAVGAVGASVLAVLASGAFPISFVRTIESEVGIRFEPLVHGLGPVLLVVGLLAWVGLTLVVGARTERARRPVSFVESLVARVGRLKPAMGLRFAFARHPRDAGGVSTPVVGLFAVLAVFVAAATFADSLDTLMEDPGRQGVTYDTGIGQGGGEIPEAAAATVADDPDVASLTLLGNIRVSVDGAGFDISGYDSVSGDLGLRVLEGSGPTAADEVALGRTAAGDFGVGVGDQLTVDAASGERSLDVVGIVVMPGIEGGDGLGEGGLVTADTLRSLDDEAALSFAAITFRPEADAAVARTRLSNRLEVQMGPPEPPGVVQNLDRVRSAPYVVAGILAALALLSLANLMLVALRHRAKELAVLRASGADRRWVGGVAHWHAVAFTVAVAALATPFGIVLGRVVFRIAIADRIGVAPDTFVPTARLLLTLAVLALVADVVGQVTVRGRNGSVARQLTAE